MKQNERTRHIPVIILTTTNDLNEVTKCYNLGCNAHITKPIEYTQFTKVIYKLGLVLSVITIPTGG